MRPKPQIGIVSATLFAIGSMVGGGVFALSGTALQTAGPSAILSFLFAGMIVLLSALSLAIVAGKTPAGEAGYDEVGDVLGGTAMFVVSWCFYLNAVIVTAFVLNAFGIYFQEFVTRDTSVAIVASIAAVIIGCVNFLPARLIGRFESFMVWIKLAALALLIGAGIPHLLERDFSPFFTNGVTGMMSAGSTLFIAFLGFNVITNISSQIKNASRTVPRAILASMLVVTVIYIGVVLAMLAAHLPNYSEASVGIAAEKLIGPLGGLAVIVGALLATLSAANANMLGASETIMRMADKKSVPSILAKPWKSHPVVSVILGVAITLALIALHVVSVAVELANVFAIVALVVINIAALKLFVKGSKKTRWVGTVPIFGSIGALSQLLYIPVNVLLWSAGLIIGGLLLYAMRTVLVITAQHSVIHGKIKSDDSPLSLTLRQ